MKGVDAARLAGVTVLDVQGRHGPLTAFLFDPHRLALISWAAALAGRGPAVLLTLDRHLDLVPPVPLTPSRDVGLRALDEHARWELDARNVDHVLAAMEAGLLLDAVVVARTVVPGAVTGPAWQDRRGGSHQIHVVRELAALVDGFANGDTLDAARARRLLLDGNHPIILDVDVDAFTSPSDVDPTVVLPWPRALIKEALLPEDARAFWDVVLPRVVALTVAREPAHTGGVLAGNRLFEDVARVLFVDVLGADEP
jgi:hypothetical protein